MTTPTIELPRIPGLRTTVTPIVEAARLGLLSLGDELVATLHNAAALSIAAEDARRTASTADVDAHRSISEIVDRLVAEGPLPSPSTATRAARERQEALKEDSELLYTAARKSQTAIEGAFVRDALRLAGEALAALTNLRRAAHDDASLVATAGVNLAEPTSILKAPPDVQAAFTRLAERAIAHDALMRIGLAVYGMLNTHGGGDYAKRARFAELDMRPWHGFGIAGPTCPACATTSSDTSWSRDWTWKPAGSPIERLIAAALALAPSREDEPAPRAVQGRSAERATARHTAAPPAPVL